MIKNPPIEKLNGKRKRIMLPDKRSTKSLQDEDKRNTYKTMGLTLQRKK